MTATYELYLDADRHLRFRLLAPDGTVVLTSEPFADEDAAIAGIWTVREASATGKIVDLTGTS